MRSYLGNTPDQASLGLADRMRDGFPLQDLAQGIGQTSLFEFRLDIARSGLETVLVVDSSPITNDAISIEEKYFGRADGPQPVSQFVVIVLQQRKRHAVRSGKLANLAQRILQIGVDPKKRDPLR